MEVVDDQDADGFPLADDCDDTDPTVFPGAPGWTADCEPVVGDTGEPGEEPGGCPGCAAHRRGGVPALLLLLPAFLARRRRA